MPILNPSTAFSCQNLAEFRDFCLTFSGAFPQMGWVKSAVAGQTTFSVLPEPTGADFSQWEIWGMGDALQATNPCWVKIYYSRSVTNPYLLLFMEAGTGVNPDGTLQNPSPRLPALGNGNYTPGYKVPHLFWGDSGNFGAITWEDQTNYRTLWSCGRMRNTQDWSPNGAFFCMGRSGPTAWDSDPVRNYIQLFHGGKWEDMGMVPHPSFSGPHMKTGDVTPLLPTCTYDFQLACPILKGMNSCGFPTAKEVLTVDVQGVDRKFLWYYATDGPLRMTYFGGQPWSFALPWDWT